MTTRMLRQIALSGLMVPAAIGLLAACGSTTEGQAERADSATTSEVDTDTMTAAPTSSAVTTSSSTISEAADGDGSTASAPRTSSPSAPTDGSAGAVNQGSQGSAAGAAGIGTQTGPPTAPPARFTSFTLSQSSVCPLGDTITPTVSWETADATGVGISVDDPNQVAAFGTFGTTDTVSLPHIACTGSPGTEISHRYDAWALGPGDSEHRTATLTTTVVMDVMPTALPTLTAVPLITLIPHMPTLTVKPSTTPVPPMLTVTLQPAPPPFPSPIVPVNPVPQPGP